MIPFHGKLNHYKVTCKRRKEKVANLLFRFAIDTIKDWSIKTVTIAIGKDSQESLNMFQVIKI